MDRAVESENSRNILSYKSTKRGLVGVFSSESASASSASSAAKQSIAAFSEADSSPSKIRARCPRITEEGIRDFMGDEDFVAALSFFDSRPRLKSNGILVLRAGY